MLRCEDIGYAVGTKQILEGVSLHVDQGEMVALCGPNGAGKSTLLKIASGELTADQGTITFLEQSLENWPRRDLARTRAKLSQESHLTFAFL